MEGGIRLHDRCLRATWFDTCQAFSMAITSLCGCHVEKKSAQGGCSREARISGLYCRECHQRERKRERVRERRRNVMKLGGGRWLRFCLSKSIYRIFGGSKNVAAFLLRASGCRQLGFTEVITEQLKTNKTNKQRENRQFFICTKLFPFSDSESEKHPASS